MKKEQRGRKVTEALLVSWGSQILLVVMLYLCQVRGQEAGTCLASLSPIPSEARSVLKDSPFP